MQQMTLEEKSSARRHLYWMYLDELTSGVSVPRLFVVPGCISAQIIHGAVALRWHNNETIMGFTVSALRLGRCAAPWLRLAIQLGLLGGLAYFYFFVLVFPTTFRRTHYAQASSQWGVPYERNAAHGSYIIRGFSTLMVVVVWAPLLLGAILTVAADRLKTPKPRIMRRAAIQISRVLEFQIYPRKFWAEWTDGMTVLDALLTVAYVFASVFWFAIMMSNRSKELDAQLAMGLVLSPSKHVQLLHRAGTVSGVMLFVNMWLLFLPIPQSSFLQELTGMSYSSMIRYHRWQGHATMVVASVHALCYYAYWLRTRQFAQLVMDFGAQARINYAAGTISFICGLVLWVSSMAWCRRRFFEVFYRLHIFCFLGFVLFAAMHYSSSWVYMAPGLLLWGVDLVYRSTALAGAVSTPVQVDLRAGGTLAQIQLPASRRMEGCPLERIYLCVPAISRWQWHPFSVLAQSAQSGTLAVNIKRYGAFTAQLMDKLVAGGPENYNPAQDASSKSDVDDAKPAPSLDRSAPLAMRVYCPAEEVEPTWQREDAIVLVVGGVGSAAAFQVTSRLFFERRSGTSASHHLPSKVLFLWSSRDRGEFCTLDPRLALASVDVGGWLELRLHCTAPEGASVQTPDLERVASPRSESFDAAQGSSTDLGKDVSDTTGADRSALGLGVAPKGSNPFGWNVIRAVQPGGAGKLYWIGVHVLVFFGAFCGVGLSYMLVAERQVCKDAKLCTTEEYNSLYWKSGLMSMLFMGIVGLGLPYLILALPLQVYRYYKDVSPSSEEVTRSTDDAAPSACRVVKDAVVVPATDVAVPIWPGRIDIVEALSTFAAQGDESAQIGVYSAGPTSMNLAVQSAVAKLNSSQTATFACHIIASEL